ncbi:MAG TPA: biopolymer transporter ExbD [Bryobacteraceae bacterium]|nr:biopolymer transporter ExbD [Bryobacteraceae bacterium]
MAIVVNGGGSSGRRRSYGSGALSEINVTPFVDVVLVLLIIFMMTAHVMEFGIEVDVPKTKYTKDSAKDLAVINITRDGNPYLNDKPVNIHELGGILQQRYRGQAVYVRADKGVTWDIVAQVLSELRAAKITVNMVTQPEDSADKRGR